MKASCTFRLVKHVLLPSLTLIPSNPGLSIEVWSTIRDFHFSDRHALYMKGQSVGSSEVERKHVELVRSQCCACYEVKQALKRVANEKRSSKQVGRQLAKIAHSNPTALFDVALCQIETYDNMIPSIVESFNFMTALELDVLAYLIPSRLSFSRSKLQSDGIHLSSWFQHLARFTGSFFKSKPATELGGLIQFFISR